MRLIDADVLKQHIDKLPALPDGNFAGNHSALKALINMQPTVQPEIIHCGECKHKKDHHYELPGEEPYIKSTCENKYGLVKDYQVHDWDFCSRAKRRTDG